MKRYLLLASVAGCLLSANAMAETVTINTAVTVQRPCTLEVTQDMNFGKVILSADYEGTTVLIMDKDGYISEKGSVTGLVHHDERGEPGLISFTCSGTNITEKATPKAWPSQSSAMQISEPKVELYDGEATGVGRLAVSGELYLASDAAGDITGYMEVEFDF